MPKKAAWTFDTTSAFVAWMQDEYLSEIVLDALAPAPGTKAVTVSFTWWLHGTGGPSRVPYKVTARGVTRWTLKGELDTTTAIGMEAGRGSGIRIVMSVPGALTLHCASVSIQRGAKQKLRRMKVRPLADYRAFHAHGPGRPTQAAILKGLGAPAGATIDRTAKFLERVMVGGAVWIDLYDARTERARNDHYVYNVVRGTATDDEWRRAAELPKHIAATRVESAWEFEGTPAEWIAVTAAALPGPPTYPQS
jgi:hypothetical protein